MRLYTAIPPLGLRHREQRTAREFCGAEGIALPHIVGGALHRANAFIRHSGSTDLSKGSSEITGLRGVAADQQQPQQVRCVGELREQDLCLDRIPRKNDSATLTNAVAGDKSRKPSLAARSAAAGISGTFRS